MVSPAKIAVISTGPDRDEGPGSFFKNHVDTPRDGSMVATLVIVLPTEHKGGDLLLLGEKPWTFESSKLVSRAESGGIPRLAFVGFYSDVEHEVTPVDSGYRVTVTYNLYASQRTASISPQLHLATPEEKILHNSLRGLLSQPAVLPNGGFLGFGLTYKYPIAYDQRELDCFTGVLKGRDALIERTCEALGLTISVQAKYSAKFYSYRQEKEYNDSYLLPTTKTDRHLSNQDSYGTDDEFWAKRHFSVHGVKIRGFKAGAEARHQVIWVTKPNDLMKVASPYLAYGNEASLAWKYGYLVLVAAVPPYDERSMDGN
jgi:2OG-Fe(II) oxygenase superfamily